MKIKDDFHYVDDQNGHLWNNLSENEKEELLIAYDKSFDSNNLLSHEQVKQQHYSIITPH